MFILIPFWENEKGLVSQKRPENRVPTVLLARLLTCFQDRRRESTESKDGDLPFPASALKRKTGNELDIDRRRWNRVP